MKLIVLILISLYLSGCFIQEKRSNLYGPWRSTKTTGFSPDLTDSIFFLPTGQIKVYHLNAGILYDSTSGKYTYDVKSKILIVDLYKDVGKCEYEILKLTDSSLIIRDVKYKGVLTHFKLKE